MKCFLAVFLALFSLGCCQSNLNAYPFSAVLRTDGNGNPLYTVHWNFSAVEETITFGVNVSTNGWVGFGISPNGGMTNSDVVIGWVNDNGEVFFHVRKLSGATPFAITDRRNYVHKTTVAESFMNCNTFFTT